MRFIPDPERVARTSTPGSILVLPETRLANSAASSHALVPMPPVEMACSTGAGPAVFEQMAPEFVDLVLGHDDRNDAGNAKRIARFAHGRLMWCPGEKSFYTWDGRRYRKSATEHITLAKSALYAFLEQAKYRDDYRKFAVNNLDQKRIMAALDSVKDLVAVNHQDLDKHAHLLNCRNGVVNLKTGALMPHDMTLKLTKLVNLDYGPHATCPVFLQSFGRVLPGKLDHIQKCLGYTVTAETIEKVVFICYGTGNNGKTTLMETVRRVFAEYSCKIMIDSLMSKATGESNNTMSDLSDLKGARFASTSETESGQRLSEGKLKRITQGMGVIKSARKYENTIEFFESHKLWIDANHLPVIKGNDLAIWNRMYTIPFAVALSNDQIDKSLPSKLDAEAEGILAWIVAGAVRWYAEGLGKPDWVQEAQDDYRSEMDIIGPFLEARCVLDAADPDRWCAKTSLYDADLRWTEDQVDKRKSGRDDFFAYLTSKGLRERWKSLGEKRLRAIEGIALKPLGG
jgi:putative DNA primase/helicase